MSDIHAALAPIRQRFFSRCAEDAATLRRALDGKDDDAARVLAHRIAGIAGTIGFPRISEAAAALEDAIEAGASPAQISDAAEALLLLLDERTAARPS